MKTKVLLIILVSIACITSSYFFLTRNKPTKKLKAPVVIFDFDGTIADSLDVMVILSNQILREYNYPGTVTAEDLRTQHLTAILKSHNVPLYKLPFIQKRAQEIMKDRIDDLTPIAGIREALQELKAQGFSLAIVTSNAEGNVKKFLKNHNMDYFDAIHSGSSLFGKHVTLKDFLSMFRLTQKDVVYVGDETRDIEACHKAGINVIAVSCGFNKKELLEEAKPSMLVDKPEELSEVVGKFFKIMT